MQTTKIALFQGKKVRKVLYNKEWWFSVGDVVKVLTDTPNAGDYIKKIRLRDEELNKGWGQIVTPLFIDTEGGRQKLNCANTAGILRLIQSIPSPKAEPFKLWLAKVGHERIQEIENPELAITRIIGLYKAKGYPNDWIAERLNSIAVRDKLTKEWSKRGVKEGVEYSILTSEISKAAFGVTPKEHKKLKGLKSGNLRDRMTDLELIFNLLGEAATTEIAKAKDVQGFVENKKAAHEGGSVAGRAREDLEKKTGKKLLKPKGVIKA